MREPIEDNPAASDGTPAPTNGAVTALRAAAPYVRAHRGRTFVAHLPGEAAASQDFTTLVHDLALIASLGTRLVIVIGARPQIDAALNSAGIETRLVRGVRVTDTAALAEVKKAIGALHVDVEALLSTSLARTTLGAGGITTASGNFVTAKPLGVIDGVDHGHTGEVRRIDTDHIRAALTDNRIVLLPALGYSPSGEIFNLFAEALAARAAIDLAADKLVFLHPGAAWHQQFTAVPRQLGVAAAEALAARADTGLDGADRARLEGAAAACRAGVARAQLVSFTESGALLNELYSRDGAGTLVTADGFDTIRPATVDDLAGVLALIEPLAKLGALVARSRESIELDLDYYMVMERDGLITACAALVPYPDAAAGELACVAVHPDYRGQARAADLLRAVEQRAETVGLEQLFALTTRAPDWFVERGFTPASRSDLPVARQALYNEQRNSAIFIKSLAGARRG